MTRVRINEISHRIDLLFQNPTFLPWFRSCGQNRKWDAVLPIFWGTNLENLVSFSLIKKYPFHFLENSVTTFWCILPQKDRQNSCFIYYKNRTQGTHIIHARAHSTHQHTLCELSTLKSEIVYVLHQVTTSIQSVSIHQQTHKRTNRWTHNYTEFSGYV